MKKQQQQQQQKHKAKIEKFLFFLKQSNVIDNNFSCFVIGYCTKQKVKI